MAKIIIDRTKNITEQVIDSKHDNFQSTKPWFRHLYYAIVRLNKEGFVVGGCVSVENRTPFMTGAYIKHKTKDVVINITLKANIFETSYITEEYPLIKVNGSMTSHPFVSRSYSVDIVKLLGISLFDKWEENVHYAQNIHAEPVTIRSDERAIELLYNELYDAATNPKSKILSPNTKVNGTSVALPVRDQIGRCVIEPELYYYND